MAKIRFNADMLEKLSVVDDDIFMILDSEELDPTKEVKFVKKSNLGGGSFSFTNIIYVDSSAEVGGDGSISKPYQTLSEASSSYTTNTITGTTSTTLYTISGISDVDYAKIKKGDIVGNISNIKYNTTVTSLNGGSTNNKSIGISKLGLVNGSASLVLLTPTKVIASGVFNIDAAIEKDGIVEWDLKSNQAVAFIGNCYGFELPSIKYTDLRISGKFYGNHINSHFGLASTSRNLPNVSIYLDIDYYSIGNSIGLTLFNSSLRSFVVDGRIDCPNGSGLNCPTISTIDASITINADITSNSDALSLYHSQNAQINGNIKVSTTNTQCVDVSNSSAIFNGSVYGKITTNTSSGYSTVIFNGDLNCATFSTSSNVSNVFNNLVRNDASYTTFNYLGYGCSVELNASYIAYVNLQGDNDLIVNRAGYLITIQTGGRCSVNHRQINSGKISYYHSLNISGGVCDIKDNLHNLSGSAVILTGTGICNVIGTEVKWRAALGEGELFILNSTTAKLNIISSFLDSNSSVKALIKKIAGTLYLENARFKCGSANPILCSANTSDSKDIYVNGLRSNKEVFVPFDGSSYAPNPLELVNYSIVSYL